MKFYESINLMKKKKKKTPPNPPNSNITTHTNTHWMRWYSCWNNRFGNKQKMECHKNMVRWIMHNVERGDDDGSEEVRRWIYYSLNGVTTWCCMKIWHMWIEYNSNYQCLMYYFRLLGFIKARDFYFITRKYFDLEPLMS